MWAQKQFVFSYSPFLFLFLFTASLTPRHSLPCESMLQEAYVAAGSYSKRSIFVQLHSKRKKRSIYVWMRGNEIKRIKHHTFTLSSLGERFSFLVDLTTLFGSEHTVLCNLFILCWSFLFSFSLCCSWCYFILFQFCHWLSLFSELFERKTKLK